MNTKRFSTVSGNSVLVLACVVFVAFALLHLRLAASSGISFADGSTGSRSEPNSIAFAVTGGLFLLLTFVAHALTVRGLMPRRSGEPQGDDRLASSPAMILIPMMIRFAGTFAILGGLFAWGAVGRREAVFDVLFWYVTLTTLEVAGIVWAFRSIRANEMGSLTSRPDAA